jgi:hypothetical protein
VIQKQKKHESVYIKDIDMCYLYLDRTVMIQRKPLELDLFPLQKSVFVLMYSETIDARLAPLDYKTLRLYFEISLGSDKGKQVPIPEDINVYTTGHTKLEHQDKEFILLFNRNYFIQNTSGNKLKINSNMFWPSSISLKESMDISTPVIEDLDMLSIFPLVEDINNHMDRSAETYSKAWDILQSYNITKFKEDLNLNWPDKQALSQRMLDILVDPHIHTVEQVCWAVYLKKTKLYI